MMVGDDQLPGDRPSVDQVTPFVKKKDKSGFLPAVGSFNIQYNLNSASIATDVMSSTSYLPLALYRVPNWTDQIELSIVFVGVMVGTLFMGRLGDMVGRVRAMQVTIAVSALGAVIPACAVGVPNLVYGMVCFGRFVLGIGVGGIFPLAAVSAAEGSGDLDSRSRNVARAFFWQTPGKIVPYLLGMFLFGVIEPEPPVEWVPQMEFRLLFALGVLPGLIVLIGSMSDEDSADFKEAQRGRAKESLVATLRALPSDVLWTLAGTSGTWFLFDISYYGISIFTPAILEAICLSGTKTPDGGCNQTLYDTAWQSVLTTLFQFPGVIAAILLIDKWGSKRLNVYGFLLTAVCCLAFSVVYAVAADNTGLLFSLYCMVTFALSFGPNLGCYVLPAICFPTHARSTCSGLSAMSGKLGAVVGTFAFGLIGKNALPAIFAMNCVISVLGAVLAQISLRHDWEYLDMERERQKEISLQS